MNEDRYNGEQRRGAFRIRYPIKERPRLVFQNGSFEIIDISERGVRFNLGPTINATITFSDGESFPMEGKIIRIQNNEIVVHLTKGIPFERIIKEQRNLINKYPGYR